MSAPLSDVMFEALKAEWEATVAKTLGNTAEWEAQFEEMAAEYWELRRQGRWVQGPADFLGILGRGRDELAHSAILAWLLSPEGRHGFGSAFLDRLVADHLVGLEPGAFRVRSVQTEVQRAETRADIVVWGDVATIVFEVKVDAEEGDRQCDRLFRRFGQEPDARFVFLTPSGRLPLTGVESAGMWAPVSFRQIRHIIEEVLAESAGGEAVSVAANYLLTLRREFG